jgi:Tol biopolymer transport system component
MVPVEDPRLGKPKLWLYNLVQGTASPFTFGDSSDNYPAWSADGKKVAYASNRTGQEDIYLKSVSGESSE